jgi:hypothetical protein
MNPFYINKKNSSFVAGDLKKLKNVAVRLDQSYAIKG